MASKRKSAKKTQKKESPPQPAVLLDERKRKAVQVLAFAGYVRGKKTRSGAITNAARQAGCDRNTIYSWLEDPDFLEAIDEGKEIFRLKCLSGLARGAERMNVAACIAGLKIIEPELYDEQMRRDLLKHQYAIEMEELKHKHRMEELELRERLNLPPDDDDDELPDIVFRETGPGERISLEQPKKPEDLQ